jgi:hypothetical protein
VFRSVLGRHAGVVEYQVRQTRLGARIAVRPAARVDLDALGADVAEALAGVGVVDPVISVTAVDRLERDPGPAKLRRFVPMSDGVSHLREPELAGIASR